MPGEGVMSYFGSIGSIVENLSSNRGGDDTEQSKSGSVVGFLTKTAVLGGIVASSYYLGKDSTKPNGVVNKILGKSRVNKAKVDGCVLHSHDHCPFAMRVELALAFLGVPYERKLYRFSDIEGRPKLLRKKELPAVEYLESYTTDSLKIIEMLDSNTSYRSIPPVAEREDLKQWLEDTREMRDRLSNPRIVEMPVKDWQEKQDKKRFKRKGSQGSSWGSNFKTVMGQTDDLIVDDLISKINGDLEEFSDKILYDEYGVNEFGFGMDDILTLPHLRTLTCVKGIKWPKKVRGYLKNAFAGTEADLYFKHAIE